jgi:acyl-CoA dehydrogenase
LAGQPAPKAAQHGDRAARHAGADHLRNQKVFGHMKSPGGEAALRVDDLREPKANIIPGPGRGFEIAHGCLGSGCIHR